MIKGEWVGTNLEYALEHWSHENVDDDLALPH
jgi:hypothetical protein